MVLVGLANVVAIAVGYSGMALRRDGTVITWGYNSDDQTNVPSGLSNVTAIAAGNSHFLALRSDGTVVAWGSNLVGATNVPPGLSDVVAIAAGAAHSLALKADGTVIAWGYNLNGQSSVPDGLANVIAIAAGAPFSLALRSTATGTNSLLSRLLIERLPGSGQLQFTLIDTLPGRHFEIEASADLENWTPLTSLLSTGSPIRFMDPASTDSTQRFYRTRLR